MFFARSIANYLRTSSAVTVYSRTLCVLAKTIGTHGEICSGVLPLFRIDSIQCRWFLSDASQW